jgi:hypothetical protein
LFGVFAVRCAPEIHIRIYESVSAIIAFARRIIFEKLNVAAAFRAIYIKDGSLLPVPAVLSGAFHCFLHI